MTHHPIPESLCKLQDEFEGSSAMNERWNDVGLEVQKEAGLDEVGKLVERVVAFAINRIRCGDVVAGCGIHRVGDERMVDDARQVE